MLTLYQPRRSKSVKSIKSTKSSSSSSSTEELEAVIPAGKPYLTKINGRLVMAREKRDKPIDIAVELLGEAFGEKTTTRIVRRRAKSLDKPPVPLLIGGIAYAPQPPGQIAFTTPIAQQGFPVNVNAGLPGAAHYQQSFQPQFYQQQLLPQQPVLLQPLPPPQRYTVPSAAPTEQDLEQLPLIDAHFAEIDKKNKKNQNKSGKGNSPAKEEIGPKTTVMVMKHVCANCGRLRSRKYHHDNPIKDDEMPLPAFCRKCQKDVSETSEDSGGGRGPKGSRSWHEVHRGWKRKEKQKSKHVESSSDSESTIVARRKSHPKPIHRNKSPKFSKDEGYDILEEEGYVGQQQRGRRQRDDRYEDDDRSTRARPLSNGRLERYEIPGQAPRRRRKQRVSGFRYVEPLQSVPPQQGEKLYPRKVPIRFLDDEDDDSCIRPMPASAGNNERPLGYYGKDEHYEDASPTNASKQPTFEDYEAYQAEGPKGSYVRTRSRDKRTPAPARGDSPDHLAYGEVWPKPSRKLQTMENDRSSQHSRRENSAYVERKPVSRENSFDKQTDDSLRSDEAARRRRRERAYPETETKPWKEPHVFRPGPKDELVVVTERYEYRPKREPILDEQERRRQEYLDRKMLDTERTAERQTKLEARKEAARYYNDDWLEEQVGISVERPQGDESKSRGYRRDDLQDDELATESGISYRHIRAPQPNPPRVPTPPSPATSVYRETSQHQIPYPRSSSSDVRSIDTAHSHLSTKLEVDRENKSLSPPPQTNTHIHKHKHKHHHHNHHLSMPRPTYVHETEDGRKERVTVPSLGYSDRKDAEYEVEEYDSMLSGLTERERRAEREVEREAGGRHVTFRDDISQRSGGWEGASESAFVESERGADGNASGWADADTGGAGAW